MVCSGENRGSNSSVGIGNQSIGGLTKDSPNSMMARLVEHVRGRVIGEMNHRLGWGTDPATQGNCSNELGAKTQLESL